MSDVPSDTALTTSRNYLAEHRRLIVGRALAAAAAGTVPLPVVDDWIIERVLGSGYKKIANDHQIDVSPEALRYFVHGATPPTSWGNMATTAIVMRLAARNWRTMLLALTAARRARAAGRTFLVMTLFDHYCARRHTGLGLSLDDAKRVRGVITAALEKTPGTLADGPFKRGVRASLRAAVRAPLELADAATRGALRRRLSAGKDAPADVEEVSELEQAIDRALAERDGVLGKAVVAIELNLMAETNPYLDHLIATFDELWNHASNRQSNPNKADP